MSVALHATDNREKVMQAARDALPTAVVERIDKALAGPEPKSELIAVLHRLQGENGFLGQEEMAAVAQLLGVPKSTVTGVATFYHFFRLEKVGKYMISLCTGTACYVKGADRVANRIAEELGVEMGGSTEDGLFTFQQARCLGMCGLAPVLMINDEVYEKVKPDDIHSLITKYRDLDRQQAHA
tara:strand:- start:60 stop:608 length:549 start_codon:yes stop_codon:yes gene_type:complete